MTQNETVLPRSTNKQANRRAKSPGAKGGKGGTAGYKKEDGGVSEIVLENSIRTGGGVLAPLSGRCPVVHGAPRLGNSTTGRTDKRGGLDQKENRARDLKLGWPWFLQPARPDLHKGKAGQGPATGNDEMQLFTGGMSHFCHMCCVDRSRLEEGQDCCT